MKQPFENFVIDDSAPVYLQIIRHFKILILSDFFADGDEIPSRRSIAVSLGVNLNTVQKSFSELEKEGIIETPPNAKSIVRVSGDSVKKIKEEILNNEITELIKLCKQVGLNAQDLCGLIKKNWEE